MRWFRELYEKILRSCESKKAPYILGVLSFTESCCFIIPPEVMLLPMTYADRTRAWRLAMITTATSVLGAIAGYLMGALLWDVLQEPLFTYIPGFAKYFDVVGLKFQDNASLAIFLAAFTPIPFKVFTVAAGVYSAKISIVTLIIMSIIGRGIRYYLMAGAIAIFGKKAKKLIEERFGMMSMIGGVLVVLVVYLLKFRH